MSRPAERPLGEPPLFDESSRPPHRSGSTPPSAAPTPPSKITRVAGDSAETPKLSTLSPALLSNSPPLRSPAGVTPSESIWIWAASSLSDSRSRAAASLRSSAKRPGGALREPLSEAPSEESPSRPSSGKTSSIVKHAPGVPWRRASSRLKSRAISAGMESATVAADAAKRSLVSERNRAMACESGER
eukprot:scaffold59974_cov48-Phaeocystis_antarctica.AAC.1